MIGMVLYWLDLFVLPDSSGLQQKSEITISNILTIVVAMVEGILAACTIVSTKDA